MRALGFLGGTFDPVHHGHLRVALEFAEAFCLSQVALLPCYQSPHRQSPRATAQQRLAMLDLAVQNCALLSVDGQELEQDAVSYTVDTLAHIRQQQGEDCAVYFALGTDAFEHIEQWKNWQDLLQLANIVVLQRPGYQQNHQHCAWPWAQFTGQHYAAGRCYRLPVTGLAISATQIRQNIHNQQSIQFLLPPAVEQYIQQQRLYGYEK